MMSELVASGALSEFLENTTRPALQHRHALMMAAIEKYISPIANVKIQNTSLGEADIYGGYFVWFSLPEGYSAKEVADRALKEENLVVAHGNMFEVRGDEASAGFGSEVRLCFSWEEEKDIEEGVRRLGDVLKRIKNGEASSVEGSGFSENAGVFL